MKTLLTLPFLLLSLISFPSWSETIEDLVVRDGLHYKKFSDVPFTGEVTGLFQGKVKNGKREGPWVYYYPAGQLWGKGEFKNGKKEGPWVDYHDNGQLAGKGEWRNGKKEGPWVWYNPDGTLFKQFSGVYKNGDKISD